MIKNMDSAKFPTIYDVTLAVNQRDSGPATISSILLGRKTVAEAYIRKFELKDVPKVQCTKVKNFKIQIFGFYLSFHIH